MPAANPRRPFPPYIYGPLVQNLRTLIATRALRLAVVGIAFFTFVVAFMRAVVYMLGESQNPRWDELKTSVVVGTVALGIGLGSPLAGWLSGRRIELRLVPLGALGMIAACLAGAYFIEDVPRLVACIVAIGFFTGFYIVPLFTLLQHKAPKASKGDMIATSNFVNITGAIAASLMFFLVVLAAQTTGLVPKVADRQETAGELTRLDFARGRPAYLELRKADGTMLAVGTKAEEQKPVALRDMMKHVFESGPEHSMVIELSKRVRPPGPGGPFPRVTVSRFEVAGVAHYEVVPEGQTPSPDFDQRRLPRFLFVGAAGLTFLMLLVILGPLLRVRREAA
jgi:hypothetical protein